MTLSPDSIQAIAEAVERRICPERYILCRECQEELYRVVPASFTWPEGQPICQACEEKGRAAL